MNTLNHHHTLHSLDRHTARRLGPSRRRGVPLLRPDGHRPRRGTPGGRAHRHPWRTGHGRPRRLAAAPAGRRPRTGARREPGRPRRHRASLAGLRRRCLATADRDAAVDRIAGFIDELRPTTIVTFGPDGMTGHDDHRTVSSWVTEAREKAGHPNRLWYATVTPDFHARWGEVNERVRLWFEGSQPPVTPREDLAAEIVCDLGMVRRKHAGAARPRLPDRPAGSRVGRGALRPVVGHRVLRGRTEEDRMSHPPTMLAAAGPRSSSASSSGTPTRGVDGEQTGSMRRRPTVGPLGC